MLQKVRYPGRSIQPLTVHLKAHIHTTVVCGKEGIAFLKIRLWVHIDMQAIVQYSMKKLLTDLGKLFLFHSHTAFPFKK